jgi:hypothetical protein
LKIAFALPQRAHGQGIVQSNRTPELPKLPGKDMKKFKRVPDVTTNKKKK